MARSKTNTALADEAKADLLKLLKPGDTVYTILRHVSSSRMYRVIDLVIPAPQAVRTIINETMKLRSVKGLEAYQRSGDDQFRTAAVIMQREDDNALLLQYPAHANAEPFKLWCKRADLTVTRTTQAPSIRSIGWLVARATGDSFDGDRQGIKVGGTGMDMGFHLVYGLGRTLWPDGTAKPHGTRNGEPDRDGGYALKHSWL